MKDISKRLNMIKFVHGLLDKILKWGGEPIETAMIKLFLLTLSLNVLMTLMMILLVLIWIS